MSALDGWFDACRTGTYQDMGGNAIPVTEATLDALAASVSQGDPAPVVVGHPETDAPAYAWVDAGRRVGDRFQVRLRNIQPAFRAAVESGAYTGRSVAFAPGEDGAPRLRHLGFLGAARPAVPGLAPTQFAEAADSTVVTFAAPDTGAWRTLAHIMRRWREHLIERDGIEAADRLIMPFEIENLKPPEDDDGAIFSSGQDAPPSSEEGQGTEAGAQDGGGGAGGASPPPPTEPTEPEDSPMSGTTTNNDTPAAGDEVAAQREENARRSAELDRREAELAAQQAEAERQARLAEADRVVEESVQAGRVLPRDKPRLAALLASLPDGNDTVIAFAAPDGKSEVSETPRALLERYLSEAGKVIEYDVIAPRGEDAPAGLTDKQVSDKAARLSAETGMNEIEAVDAVRSGAAVANGGTN